MRAGDDLDDVAHADVPLRRPGTDPSPTTPIDLSAKAMSSAPLPFPGDPIVDEALAASHKLTPDEFALVNRALGRAPTYTELGVFSVMFSEHCSYKSSRVHLRRLPTSGPRVIQGPGENAGVVDLGDGWAVVFKMESHNHPSFIEPYQGAATGVGGILRDVFTMGARPIANLNSLRFGRPDHPRTPELLRGVVAGIGGYGNCIGVPTVGGEVQFDPAYDGNVLVNAMTVGIARKDRIFYGRAAGVGNPILYVGAKTGRDGIHGATMASAEFDASKKAERPTVQVGDPFMEKLLLEACLEIFKEDLLEGIQDMGAAGLTSSSTEMCARAGTGLEIDLDLVPRRAKKLHPYEILLSESQERMLLVAKKGREARVVEICKKWELDAVVIGRVTDTKRWVVKATPGRDPLDPEAKSPRAVVVCDLPVDVLVESAPKYDRPRRPDASLEQRRSVDVFTLGTMPEGAEQLAAEIVALCGSPNLGSKQWIYRQYDHMVRGGTLVRPGSDAAIVRVPCEKDDGSLEADHPYKYLALSVDCDGRMCELDARNGAAMAVAECARNVVCGGAEPIGLTDCLNFGNPERPEVMQQLSDAIDGIADACRALKVPVVSGNVSLYNETIDRAGKPRGILPTPTVGVVGLVSAIEDVVVSSLDHGERKPRTLLLLGARGQGALGGSEYVARRSAEVVGAPPRIDLEAEARLQKLVLSLARAHVLHAAHDVSSGGLSVALVEMSVGGVDDVGIEIDLGAPAKAGARAIVGALFGEDPSRVIVAVDDATVADVERRAQEAGVPCERLGRTTERAEVVFRDLGVTLSCPLLRDARERSLESIVGR